jgi:murein DD-endopeptidase MepM/ murein hydrolase activator NlpD
LFEIFHRYKKKYYKTKSYYNWWLFCFYGKPQGQASNLKGKVSVDQEGVATGEFELKKEALPNILALVINPFYIGLEELPDYIFSIENGLNAIEKSSENIDENDPQLIWGAKVSKEFRVKVVQICKKLWSKNTMEMANGLMAVINRETAGTFAPNQIEGKGLISKEQINKKSFEKYVDGKLTSRAVGLIQFTQNALTSMGEYSSGGFDVLNELKVQYANMTQLEQLDKVEKYMTKVQMLPQIPEDIYVAVFAPAYVGKGLDKTMYELGTRNYNSNASLDVDKTKNGIQTKELITEFYTSLKDGEYGRNIWHNPLDKMELRGWYSTWRPNDSIYGDVPLRSAGHHDGLDLYAPIGANVYACVDGIRVDVGPKNPSVTYGNTISIKGHYNGKEYHFFYAHLSEVSIEIGDKVKAGILIGLTGNTGDGASRLLPKQRHLHFEVRTSAAATKASTNPLEAITELKSNVNMNPNQESQK